MKDKHTDTPKPTTEIPMAAEPTADTEQAADNPMPPKHRQPVQRGQVERTISRMISAWMNTERDRGHLTEEIEADAAAALQHLNPTTEEGVTA